MYDNFMGKKLNLKWVSEIIGSDYRKWHKGDVITIQAQTGTGKTFFITGDEEHEGLIDYLEPHEHLIYICNRTNLKRQLKIDLLKKFNQKLPINKETNGVDFEELDKITKIANIVITSYHALANGELENMYLGEHNNLDMFDYIIADECHFLLADGDFNNKCLLAYKKLIKTLHINAIKIFISATMDDVKEYIKQNYNKLKNKQFGLGDGELRGYSTGIDYSYLDVGYFKNLKDIKMLIKNDNSDEKWIVFVTNINDGEKLKKDLRDIKVEIIKSGTKSEELTSIINESKFNSKVLICTKAMDNGINIKDDSVKNVIIMSWDKITFIQEVGRIRVDITNAPEIKLYIPCKKKSSFSSLIKFTYEPKSDLIELHKNNLKEFNKRYDFDYDKLYKDIFYKSEKGWKVNAVGEYQLKKAFKFAGDMITGFDMIGEFAFVFIQLLWLGLAETFDVNKLIEEVQDNEVMESIEEYLSNNIGEIIYTKKDRKPLIEKINLIDGHNSRIKNTEDKPAKIVYISDIEQLNMYLEKTVKSNYRIKQLPRITKTIDNKRHNFKSPWIITTKDEFLI
ncbi:DEAD/DEAH box helicase [Clostridium botulinum]|uniref:DEAD/DEAH box helicase n=1 Tax=Clostridium botulinum TaxID=1491 RepID=A0A6M0SLK5_CLOBO|nr:DEAD/DEAH box helicase [Clostridium botulinum]